MSLIVPKNYQHYNVIGIDPSTSHVGISIFSIDDRKQSITKINAYTLELGDLPAIRGLVEHEHIDRDIRLFKLREQLIRIFRSVSPYIVVAESPFFYRMRPAAYGALTESIATIKHALFVYDRNIALEMLPPLTVKKSVKSSLNNDKDAVRMAISSIPSIINNLRVGLHHLDEHAVDAIAVTYSYLTLTNMIRSD